MGHRLAQPGGEGADTAGQEGSEPHSLVVPSQGDHAQALLTTPSPQVRPAQLALTSHSYRLRVGCLLGGVGPQCQGTDYVGHTGLEEVSLWSPPDCSEAAA